MSTWIASQALWKRVMIGWLRGARRGDVFPFRVELGPPGYAILGADGREISDRWAQQKAMRDRVERLWNEAVAETGIGGEARPPGLMLRHPPAGPLRWGARGELRPAAALPPPTRRRRLVRGRPPDRARRAA